MKLYFKPGACSLASHIALLELGREFSLEAVDTDTQRTASGKDFTGINPKGYVPALDIGSAVLTEGAAVLQYLAEGSALLPNVGTLARSRVQEHLNFVASELHKAFGPFFNHNASDEQRAQSRMALQRHFTYLETLFSDSREYLVGEQFTIADAYLFVVCNWSGAADIELKHWPALNAFCQRIATRPSAKAAMQQEGLISA